MEFPQLRCRAVDHANHHSWWDAATIWHWGLLLWWLLRVDILRLLCSHSRGEGGRASISTWACWLPETSRNGHSLKNYLWFSTWPLTSFDFRSVPMLSLLTIFIFRYSLACLSSVIHSLYFILFLIKIWQEIILSFLLFLDFKFYSSNTNTLFSCQLSDVTTSIFE